MRYPVSKDYASHAHYIIAQGGRCFYCRRPLSNGFTRDHVIPRFHGGGRRRNIVLACSLCNHKKAHRPPSDEELERLESLYEKIAQVRAEGHDRIKELFVPLATTMGLKVPKGWAREWWQREA